MSHQYAPSYPPPRETQQPFASIIAILGRLGDSTAKSKHDHHGAGITVMSVIRRRLLSISTALVLLWIWVLHWGEQSAMNSHVKACDWESWEKWPTQAQPHRVALVADPQLVDPHTYPGRPWPLSSLTVAFTDLYLKRSYKQLNRQLNPDTVFFLGDLFDGGREWATDAAGFEEKDASWKKYRESFWLKEYDRFGTIFFSPDQVSGGMPVTKSKKVIASLPGNHDLGFGNGIQKPVRDRFRAYFGEGDRVDVIGNHTFVSLDTVSLSAMGQPDAHDDIWQGTMHFLDNAQELKKAAVQQALNLRRENPSQFKFSHDVTFPLDIDDYERRTKANNAQEGPDSGLPTIVLSHVPLYRDPGTPCGPSRERSPPSAPNLDNDEPNAIRVAAGYQYQNVLTSDISKLIAEKVSNVGYAFSGDDHDYCEMVHRSYPSAGSGIREITVKSMSWAMGVRKPGFLMVSLWNPVDSKGRSVWDVQGGQKSGEATLQTHLCLLPDQLAIFIRYGVCAGFSLLVLAVHAVVEAKKGGSEATASGSNSPVLPIAEPKQARNEKKSRPFRAASGSLHSNSSTESSNGGGALLSRSLNARTRSVSPMPGSGGEKYSLPTWKGSLIEQAGYYGSKKYEIMDGETDDWGNPQLKIKPPKPRSFVQRLTTGFGRSLFEVATPTLIWYWWLLRN